MSINIYLNKQIKPKYITEHPINLLELTFSNVKKKVAIISSFWKELHLFGVISTIKFQNKLRNLFCSKKVEFFPKC